MVASDGLGTMWNVAAVYFKVLSQNFPESNERNLFEHIRPQNRESNLGPPIHEAAVVTTEALFSLTSCLQFQCTETLSELFLLSSSNYSHLFKLNHFSVYLPGTDILWNGNFRKDLFCFLLSVWF